MYAFIQSMNKLGRLKPTTNEIFMRSFFLQFFVQVTKVTTSNYINVLKQNRLKINGQCKQKSNVI